MGRSPKPTVLKILKGTDQACRVRDDEPQPDSDNIQKPPNLSERAHKYWDQLIGLLTDARMLTNVDAYAFAALCEEAGIYFEASEQVQKTGLIVKGKNGYPVQSPYLRIMNQSQGHMRKWFIEFGMTPSARTRVGTNGKKAVNEFDF